MKTITVGFSKSTKPFAVGSWLIRWYMGTEYSHVYIKFHSPSLERTLIYEAVGAGVRFIGLDRWQSHAQEVASFQLTLSDENYKRLMQFCVDNAGIDYGFFQNIGILVANVAKLERNLFNDGKNCSEEIGEILELEGFDIEKDFNLLTPKDIYEILEQKLKPDLQNHPQE